MNNSFYVVSDEGKEIRCDVLFTFENDNTRKNYIVYTDNTRDEEGNTKVYASIYDPDDPAGRLMPLESEKEWKYIEVILETLTDEVRAMTVEAHE